MNILVGYELSYDCPQPTPMLLMLNIHYCHAGEIVLPYHLVVEPAVPLAPYRDMYGNWCSRLIAPAGRMRISTSAVVRSTGQPEQAVPNAVQHPIGDLPEDTLIYLLGSRYCETDLLMDTAWKLFGQTPLGWGRVQAIYQERVGVCRDFAHLAVAFCRCLNIPARYCTGYLSDIGQQPPFGPMDFSGWFEAYLGGQWHVFDPRNNTPRIGRILIARGRDAVDVAISTAFGPNTLTGFTVTCVEVPPPELATNGNSGVPMTSFALPAATSRSG
jgi:transglutaminase-like putative cysteine protease